MKVLVDQQFACAAQNVNPSGPIYTKPDLHPQPLGCPPNVAIPGETGEQRAFRRFPINAHKPAR